MIFLDTLNLLQTKRENIKNNTFGNFNRTVNFSTIYHSFYNIFITHINNIIIFGFKIIKKVGVINQTEIKI